MEIRPDGTIVMITLRTHIDPGIAESAHVIDEVVTPTATFEIGAYGQVREQVYDYRHHLWRYRR